MQPKNANLIKEYAFADFPRGALPTAINRRQFFQGIIHDLRTIRTDDAAPKSIRLTDLGSMPDDELAQVVPTLLPECVISVHHGYVWGNQPEDKDAIRLFPQDIQANFVLGLFDGKNTVRFASEVLAEQFGWDANLAFAYTRGVFLWLVVAKLFAPKGKKTKEIEMGSHHVRIVQKL